MDTIATVYVVNWEPTSVGGFEWRIDRADAEEFRRYLQDPTARTHVVALPTDLAELVLTDPDAVTEWLDTEGWSDGIDPRV